MRISSHVPMDEILTQQITPLQQQLTKLFTKYPVNVAYKWHFENQINEQFMKSFTAPVPTAIEKRAVYEKQLITSIHHQLERDHLILRRTANDYNTFYLGNRQEFNAMAQNYIENTGNFECIGAIDDVNTEEKHLNDIIQSIHLALEELAQKKVITVDYLRKLQIHKKSTIKLPYLYFLPQVAYPDNKIKTLQPRFLSYENAPIQTLATFLDQLLQPLYEKKSQPTAFLNGADFIRKIQHYCIQQGTLRPQTNFVTFEVHNLYSTVLHPDILTALNRCIVIPVNEGLRHQGLTSDAIEELTGVVLRNNTFIYNGKVYRYLKGLPVNLHLTELLCNIYLQHWQSPLFRQICVDREFFGRYHNLGLMTWYESNMKKLEITLNELKQQNPDIEVTTSAGPYVNFLNAGLENKNGHLHTYMYHDPITEQQPFLLPYIANHPRLGHRQWFRFALIRAGQYCPCYEDFQEERVQIELTFLANGYSLEFVEYHLAQFLKRFNPSSTQPTMDLNRLTYTSLRVQLIRHFQQQKLDIEERKLLQNKHQLIELSYFYDWGSRHEFNRQFYELWTNKLNKDATFKKNGLKIILNSKHCFLSNTLLVRYKKH